MAAARAEVAPTNASPQGLVNVSLENGAATTPLALTKGLPFDEKAAAETLSSGSTASALHPVSADDCAMR